MYYAKEMGVKLVTYQKEVSKLSKWNKRFYFDRKSSSGFTHVRPSLFHCLHYWPCWIWEGARGCAVSWGTVLQAGSSQARFPMLSLEFVSDRNMILGSIQPLTEMSTKNFSWGVKAADA